MNIDKRVDAYIKKSAPFSQPILLKMRELVHKACPHVTETIKWGMPSFDYEGPMFSFAAFKHHCVGGFWKAQLLKDLKGYLGERKNEGGKAMGHLGRMKTINDLPPDKVLIDFIKQHMVLNEKGIRLEKKPKTKVNPIVPDFFIKALKKHKLAWSAFEKSSPSCKKEYIMWITEAKTDATREKRIKIACEWIAEGKGRNWKYERKK